ncbi:hypothetical protein [Halohasta litorea]|uniref:Uncharacterized protein n=1 Tax=Halohasta litorea TaxID=869891 RepID=A0ABD6DFK7_9EURY|nr:hypothetical protein [Halohasta litorea]
MSNQSTSIPTDDKLAVVENRLKTASREFAAAIEQSTGLRSTDHPQYILENTHAELLDTYRELVNTLDIVERAIDDLDDHATTPWRLKKDHANRLAETYDDPVRLVTIQLLEANRRKWLHAKTETNGAQQVERHGLTANQREWLNEIRDGYEPDE